MRVLKKTSSPVFRVRRRRRITLHKEKILLQDGYQTSGGVSKKGDNTNFSVKQKTLSPWRKKKKAG